MPSWSFKGQSFDIVADSPIFDEWFAAKTLTTVDPVLGTTGLRYVHIGATDIQPLAFVMQWKGMGAVASRTTMKGYRMLIGTLTDDDGRSCQALLADCVDIRVKSPSSGYVRLGATFIYVSA